MTVAPPRAHAVSTSRTRFGGLSNSALSGALKTSTVISVPFIAIPSHQARPAPMQRLPTATFSALPYVRRRPTPRTRECPTPTDTEPPTPHHIRTHPHRCNLAGLQGKPCSPIVAEITGTSSRADAYYLYDARKHKHKQRKHDTGDRYVNEVPHPLRCKEAC